MQGVYTGILTMFITRFKCDICSLLILGGMIVFTLSKIKYDSGAPDHKIVIGRGIHELVDQGTWELVDKSVINYHSGYLADMFTVRLR